MEQCPKCDSKKIRTIGKLMWFIGMWAGASAFFWVGFIFMPLWIIAAVLVIGSPVAFFMPQVQQCKDCNYSQTKKRLKKVKAST